jgi:hypothetical protein
MGSSISVDVVKAAAGIWQDGNSIAGCCPRNPPPDSLIPYYNAKNDTCYKECPDVKLPVTINGWKSPSNEVGTYEYIGKKKLLGADFWSKGDKRVYEINEDEDAAGGGESITMCADSVGVLKEFLDDMGIVDYEIEEDACVKQCL